MNRKELEMRTLPKYHMTLGECWYLFQRENSLRRTLLRDLSEKGPLQEGSVLRRDLSEKDLFKKENQNIPEGLHEPREERGDPRPPKEA